MGIFIMCFLKERESKHSPYNPFDDTQANKYDHRGEVYAFEGRDEFSYRIQHGIGNFIEKLYGLVVRIVRYP